MLDLLYNLKAKQYKSLEDKEFICRIYTKKDIQKVYTRAEFTRVKTLLIAILAKKDLRAGDFRNESMIKAGIQSLNTIIANTRLP